MILEYPNVRSIGKLNNTNSDPVGRYLYSPWPFLFFFLILTVWCQYNPFFWDTVQLSSRQAHFFYDNNFTKFLLPNDLDSGHPPVWGFYLASVWKLFGQSLPVSHWAVFPFIAGMVVFAFRLARRFCGPAWAAVFLLWVCLDPVVSGQAALVSPDMVLLCFFFMALDGLFGKYRWQTILAVIGLCLISMRGMMTGFGIFLFAMADEIFRERTFRLRPVVRKSLLFIPGGLLGIAYLLWHYRETGWIGYHPDSPWALSFQRVGLQGFIKNIAVLGWRWLDFGRIFLWIVLGFSIVYYYRRKTLPGRLVNQLGGLLLLLAVVLLPSMLMHIGLSGHRYLLPLFMVFSLLVCTALAHLHDGTTGRWLTGLVAIGFLTGHCWIYPPRISQQWDATLAHLPYYDHRTELVNFLNSMEIEPAEVGTVFPAIGPFTYRDLSGDRRGFSRADLEKQSYIFYSNIMNDFTDSELVELSNWEVVVEYGGWPIRSQLLKRPTE